jgi:hypothetical protein
VETEYFQEKEISSAKEFYMLFLKDKCDRRKKNNKRKNFRLKIIHAVRTGFARLCWDSHSTLYTVTKRLAVFRLFKREWVTRFNSIFY